MVRILTLREVNKQKKKLKLNLSAKYYNTTKWIKLRKILLHGSPLCERCLEKGIVTAADTVHHKIPFLSVDSEELRWLLFLDRDNLMSLCKSCHQEIHKEMNIKH